MPKLTKKLPSYRRHKATGQAIVTLFGHDHYLGKYGSPESYESYKRVVAEWVTTRGEASERAIDEQVVRRDLRINELLDAYLRYARSYYVKNGSDKVYASLQIGAGAGFDVKLAGKEWISEGTLQDTIDAYEKVGCDAL